MSSGVHREEATCISILRKEPFLGQEEGVALTAYCACTGGPAESEPQFLFFTSIKDCDFQADMEVT